MTDVIRIGNCSGFYGDRLAAAREMIDGGPIDVLTGDYLAELTMSILYNQQQTRGENVGYVGTFLKQLKDVASDCKARGIKIVTKKIHLSEYLQVKNNIFPLLFKFIKRCWT